MQHTSSREYKVVLLGAAGVGKTAFLDRLSFGTFPRCYMETTGVEVRVLQFQTETDGLVQFNVWECAGQEYYSKARTTYLENADAVLIMTDAQSRLSEKMAIRDIALTRSNLGDAVPIIIIRNKCELLLPRNSDARVTIPIGFEVSAKTKLDIKLPFLELAHQFIGEHCAFI